MHKLLQRQLHRYLQMASLDDAPEEWRRLLEAVDEAYTQADDDRALFERSLNLTSDELLQRNEELARSMAEMEQFTSVASHDLQEPLRTVIGYTQLLARRYRDQLDDSAVEFIDGAVAGAERMSKLIEDLRSYARVGSRAVDPVTVDLNEALASAVDNLREAITASSAVIDSATLPTLEADRTQIVQLFQNLLSNAIKFRGDATPVISVSATRDQAGWRIDVADNGIGIPARYREKIFEMFQRLHGHGRYPGTGIGLAICAKIVQRHQGRMWVDSEEGQGSTFSMQFPVPSTKEQAVARAAGRG